jgi:hypothetical protein
LHTFKKIRHSLLLPPYLEEENINFFALYKEFHQLQLRWEKSKNVKIILCGSEESSVENVLQEFADSRVSKLRYFHRYHPSKTTLFEGSYQHGAWKNEVTLLKIGQLRKWKPEYRGSQCERVWLVFRISDFLNEEAKQQNYKEFHGIMGEARDSVLTAVALTLLMDMEEIPLEFSLKQLLNFLKISPVVDLPYPYHCPFYLGPVVILINVFFPTTEILKKWEKKTDSAGFVIPGTAFPFDKEIPERLERNISSVFHWLIFSYPEQERLHHIIGEYTLIGRLLETHKPWTDTSIRRQH